MRHSRAPGPGNLYRLLPLLADTVHILMEYNVVSETKRLSGDVT